MPTKKKSEAGSSAEDSKKKIMLVTGGNGRLGRETIRALIKEGNEVRTLVKRRESVIDLPPGVIPYIGDLSDRKVLDEACMGVDAVFHLAAIVSEYKANTAELTRVNVTGTESVLQACESHGVRQFIFTSTVDVYGRKRKEILTEESELRPEDRYGYSKQLAEKTVMKYKNTIAYTIFRISNVYGPGYETSFFKIFKLIDEQKAYIIGTGKNHMPLIHVYDVQQALLLAKNNAISVGKIYNLSDGNNYTQEELFELAAQELGVPKPVKHISELVVKVLARRRGLDSDELRFLTSDRTLDITRIKNELGFHPMISIKEGSADLVKEFLEKKKNAMTNKY